MISHRNESVARRRRHFHSAQLVGEGRQLGGTNHIEPVRIYLPKVITRVEHGESIKIDAVLLFRYFTFERHGVSVGALRDNPFRGNGDQGLRLLRRLLRLGVVAGGGGGGGAGCHDLKRIDLRLDVVHLLIQLPKLVFQLLYVLLSILGLRSERLNPNGGKDGEQIALWS